MTPAIRLVGLTKTYGRGEALVRAVDDASLEVETGEAVAVTGPSGCGKSTLLQLVGGLDVPTAGQVWIGDLRIDRATERARARMRRRHVGFVFQEFHLMEELTAIENIELPALLAGASASQARHAAMELIDRVGLTDRARHLPSALSGGQKQRVAIARALVNRPAVLLADEPTGNLDTAATIDVLRLFARLQSDGQTLVLVTHDARTASTVDRLLSMRDGALVEDVSLVVNAASTPRTLMNDLRP